MLSTSGDKRFFLYDGGKRRGSKKKPSSLLQTVKSVCNEKLNGIIVSHTDFDHVGGIVQVLQTYPQTCPVLLTKRFLEDRQIKKTLQTLFKCLNEQTCVTPVDAQTIKGQFHNSFVCNFHPRAPGRLYTPLQTPQSEEADQSEFELPETNESSIMLAVMSGANLHACLTGDAPGHRVIEQFKDKSMHIFQVPHHGSKLNSVLLRNNTTKIKKHAELLAYYSVTEKPLAELIQPLNIKAMSRLKKSVSAQKRRLEVKKAPKKIKKAEKDAKALKNWPPPQQVINNAKKLKCSTVPEIPQDVKELIKKHKLQHDVDNAIKIWKTKLEPYLCKEFYDHICANIYVITCGRNNYGHPSIEVINGIAEAAVERNRQCKIILTSNSETSKAEVKAQFSDVFFDKSHLVSVWYYDSDTANSLPYVAIGNNVMNPAQLKRITFSGKPSSVGASVVPMFVSGDAIMMEYENDNDPPAPMGDPPLSEYLKIIGYKRHNISLSTLLSFIVGPLIIDQLHDISFSEHDIKWNHVFTSTVKGSSTFSLSATGVHVISGDIKLEVSTTIDYFLPKKEVTEITLHVDNARTESLLLEAKFSVVGEKQPICCNMNGNLRYNGSCGLPPAEYLAAIGVQKEQCISMARDLKVGELIGLILNSSRATALVSTFPDFFSTNFVIYQIDAMLSSITFQQKSISEARIVATVPPDSHLDIQDGLKLHVRQVFLNLYPAFDESEQLYELGGEFEISGHYVKMSAIPNLDDAPQMKFTFLDKLSVKDVLKLLNIDTASFPKELTVPFSQLKLKTEINISSSFTINQQLLQHPHVSVISFEVDWSTFSIPFLPKCVNITKQGQLHLSFWNPIKVSNPMIGINADFTCELSPSPTNSAIVLDCSVSATPIMEKNPTYRCSVSLCPFLRPYKATNKVQGAPIVDIISSINQNVGDCVQSALTYLWPELTEAIELRALGLQLLSSGEVEGFKVDVTLQRLELVANKLELRDARLIFEYQAEPVSVDFNCQAELAFFDEYYAYVSFQLPSKETPGVFMFENEDSEFTVDKFIGGMFGLGDATSQPILSECLSISIDSVSIVFSIEESKTIITHASITLSKEELNLEIIRLSGIEVTVTLNQNDGSYSIGFSFQGFIGKALHARLQYQNTNQLTAMLQGNVILASLKKIGGVSALKEFGLKQSALQTFSPMLEGGEGRTSELDISVEIKKQPQVKYEFTELTLNLSNVLTFKNFTIKKLLYQYTKSEGFKFYGSLCKTNSSESISLELIYSEGVFTATIRSGDESNSPGLLKLSKILDLIECSQRPDIPQLQTSVDYFDLELKSGSMSFETKPKVFVSGLTADVESEGEVCVMSEPKIVLTDIKLNVEWKKDKKVTGIMKATFGFSKFSAELTCIKSEEEIICTAQLHPESIHMKNDLLQVTEQEQELSLIVPEKLLDSQLTPLALAIGVTRKQFLFMMNTRCGHGALFIGMFEKKIGVALAFSLNQGFQFAQLSEGLAFIDSCITITNAKLTISMMDGITVNSFHNSICTLTNALEQSSPQQNPLEGLNDSNYQQLNKGVSVYAEMDINQASDSLLVNLVKIQKCDSSFPSITLKASISKLSDFALSGYEVDVEAHISQITLFDSLTFSNIKFQYQLSQTRRYLELSGSICVKIAALTLNFGGMITITGSDAKFETEMKSDQPLVSPLGMDITLKSLIMKADFGFDGSPPLLEIMGSIDIGHAFDFTSSVLLKGVVPDLVIVDITSEISITSLLEFVNTNRPGTMVDLKIMNGHFHYAREDTTVKKWMVSKDIKAYAPAVVETTEGDVMYKKGIHAKCDVQLFLEIFTFDIRLDIATDLSTIEISGRRLKKIDLDYIKITDKEFREGPCLSFQKTEVNPGEFTLEVGLEILGSPWFSGTLSYTAGQEWLTGTIECEKSILWMEKPELEVKLLPDIPYVMITDFRFGKDQDRTSLGIFDLLKLLKKFCKSVWKMVNNAIHQEFDLHLKTGHNPDSERYSCVFTLSGTLKVVFFNSKDATVVIDLPELTVKVPKGFTLEKLPKLIVDTLLNAGEQIVNEIVESNGLRRILSDLTYRTAIAIEKSAIGFVEGVKAVAADIHEGLKKGATIMYEGVKSVGRRIGRFFSWLFGSIKITNAKTGEIIAEIMGGRGGRPLFNREEVIPVFGPLIGITGIHHHRKIIYTAGRAAIQLPSHLIDQEQDLEERRELIESLKDHHHQEHDSHLTSFHRKMLQVKNIKVTPYSKKCKVEWAMDPDITEIDKGDFDYHIKITAYTNVTSTVQTHTLFDGSVNNSYDVNPFTLMIKNDTPQQAPIITVSIKASVTMIVQAHGITNDVTIEGEWKTVDIILQPRAGLDPPPSVSMCYNETQQCIAGNITTVSSANSYLVQLVDDSNFNTIITQTTVDQPTDGGEVKYSFDMSHLLKCSVDGTAVYRVRALAVKSEKEVSTFTTSNEKCERTVSPLNVDFLLPHNKDDSMKVTWETAATSAQLQYFTLEINAATEDDNEQEKIIISKQIPADSNTSSYKFEYNDSELMTLLDEHKEMILKFCVLAHSKDHLPSIPATSHEMYVLHHPNTLSCYYSKERRNLHLGWTSSLHAFSYKIQLVNTQTGKSVYQEVYHHLGTSKRELDCELTIDYETLQRIIENDVKYRVEVDTLGHGDYLGSVKPAVAVTVLQRSAEEDVTAFKMIHEDGSLTKDPVKALTMQFSPRETMESIHVQWKPPQFGATSYRVSINDFESQTHSNEVFISPMSMGIKTEGEYVVSVVPDGTNIISESTFKFSALDIFTELYVTEESATSFKIHYNVIPDIPTGMLCYLVSESPPDGVIMTTVLDLRKSKEILLSNARPDRVFNVYAFAFSHGCREWAIPKHITREGELKTTITLSEGTLFAS